MPAPLPRWFDDVRICGTGGVLLDRHHLAAQRTCVAFAADCVRHSANCARRNIPSLGGAHRKSSNESPSGPSAGRRSEGAVVFRFKKSGMSRPLSASHWAHRGSSPLLPLTSATAATSATRVDFIGLFLSRSDGLSRSLSAASVALVAVLSRSLSAASATFFCEKPPLSVLCRACRACR